MNAERLHAVVIELNQEMTKAGTVDRMQHLIKALQNVVNQSNAPSQEALSQSLKAMYDATIDSPSDNFSPTWRQILSEIGEDDLFGKSLKSNIETIFARNQITTAVALEELQQLQKRLQAFKNALDQITAALKHFKIGDERLEPGECEIGVLIPRSVIENKLLDFVAELKELGFILNSFSEFSTGSKDDLAIRTISSSGLLVTLQAAAPYAALVAICIERLVAFYKQLLEIRKLRQDMSKQGVPDKATQGVQDYANTMMEQGIEKIVDEVVRKYSKVADEGRKNELINGIRISLNKIANRIDKGFNIEVRVAPAPKQGVEESANEELQQAIAAIQSATPNMQFMRLEGEPILSLPEKEKQMKKE
jgi:hypothetical protein